MYGDWRDHLVEAHRYDLGHGLIHRRFDHLPLGAEIKLSAQNNTLCYVSGRYAMGNDGRDFNLDALEDFEIAFIMDDDLMPLTHAESPVLCAVLDECGVDFNGDDRVIGYVTAEKVGCIINRLGGISHVQPTGQTRALPAEADQAEAEAEAEVAEQPRTIR